LGRPGAAARIMSLHPRQALFDAADAAPALPVCDHYCGVEARMRKSLDLQAQLGPVFDVTLDCEDGAPIGGEREHALLVAELLCSPKNSFGRAGARVHPLDHASFETDVDTLIAKAGDRLAYLMLPKPRGLADVQRAVDQIDNAARTHGRAADVPVHVLIETHGALQQVAAIAAHPRVQSLSFGLMDFVSAHRGAIPLVGMSAQGQFSHPLVVRAKLEIAAACHAHAKVPSHSVVTEFRNPAAIQEAATRAAREFGFTRMWSIHPAQIMPIVEAFAPSVAEVDEAVDIIWAAQAAQWAPIRHRDTLHDRASYRYCWQVIERAHRTGQPLPADVLEAFFGATPGKTPNT
jgi:citrate lyase subunit beta / citryl-CoA lyase